MPFEKSFTQEFNGTVWKMGPERHGPLPALALEIREGQRAEWAVLDLAENRLPWQRDLTRHDPHDERLALIGLFNGTLLLHRYGADSPQPRGLLAFDGRTGEFLYEVPGVVFGETDGQTLQVNRPVPEQEALVFDLSTGEVREKTGAASAASFSFQVPHHYAESTSYFEVVARFVQTKTGRNAVRAVDYLEVGSHAEQGYLLISYYIYDQDLLENRLLVVEGGNQVLLDERLATGPRLNPEPFGVYADRLLFLQPPNRLVVYAL